MDLSNSIYWWLILGGVLLAGEMFTGTFYLMFFGFAAFATAGLASIESSLVVQVLVFAALSVFSVWYARKRGLKSQSKGFNIDVNQVITLSASIKAGGQGMIEYQGSPWKAINQSQQDLSAGQRVKIVKVEGVHLFIEGN